LEGLEAGIEGGVSVGLFEDGDYFFVLISSTISASSSTNLETLSS